MKIRREVKIGIFALLMMFCLYWGINFLKGRDLFDSNNVYFATYDQVNGIQPSSPVKIKGYKVGTISNIRYDPARSDKIVLELTVRSRYRIPDDSHARIFSDGLMGNKAVEIELGNSRRFLSSGDTLVSRMDRDFLEVAGSEFDFFKSRFNDITDELTVTLQTINKLVEANATSVGKTMDNLAGISESLNTVIGQESDNLRGIITNLNSLSATLKQSSDRIDHIITNVDGFTDSLAQSDIPTMVSNLSGTLGEMNGILARVNAGEGTLGHLIADHALYDSLTMATGNLAALLEDIRTNPRRYVHFSVFGGGRSR